MKRFIAKLCLLSLPILAVYGRALIVLLVGRELLPIQSVIERQLNSSHLTLYGPAYVNRAADFKRQAVLVRSPAVISLGTSRVMQFRSNFFKKPRTFYNAGGGIQQIWDFRPFLRNIPSEKSPKLIIVGLDQYFFNPNRSPTRKKEPADDPSSLDILLSERRTIDEDYHVGKISLQDLMAHNRDGIVTIGLNAIEKNNGFRNDGSYYYGYFTANPHSPDHWDFQFEDTLKRIANGDRDFEYASHISMESVRELEAFLASCKEREVHVVGFLPPFAHAIYRTMMSMGNKYGYLSEIVPSITPLFDQRGYTLFDFTDIESVGSSDIETIDGYHGSEKTYLRLFLLMLKGDQRLRQVAANIDYLKHRLHTTTSNYSVFGNNEY